MNTKSLRITTVVQAAVLAGGLFLAVGYSSTATAAQGCGWGFHRTWAGVCVMNRGGYYPAYAPRYRHCWRNAWGRLRCGY